MNDSSLTEGVVALFGDGGCIGVNPSPLGAPWAVCGVDADGRRVWERVGVVEPGMVETDGVTNNQSEFVALLMGLEAMPDGWSGTVHSDSLVTIRRFRDGAKLRGIPSSWAERKDAALARLGALIYVLLDGHPTKVQLAAGVGRRGSPVSDHNVWCDKACTEAGRLFLKRVGDQTSTAGAVAL